MTSYSSPKFVETNLIRKGEKLKTRLKFIHFYFCLYTDSNVTAKTVQIQTSIGVSLSFYHVVCNSNRSDFIISVIEPLGIYQVGGKRSE